MTIRAGATIGPYRIERELGSGGMGRVWSATVEGHVPGMVPGRRVALKVVHAHLLEAPGFFRRFLREAELGKAVVHGNVVRTLDADAVLADGVQVNFLVMEYVEGQTLRDLLLELGRVPEELCRHLGREVAKGLAAIHAAGIVHRDLKPENVLVTKDHAVKLMDLGVARLQHEAVRLSQTGAFVGSLPYAAPESFAEGGRDVDGRADLHALGLVLYELSTGVNPYEAADVAQVVRRVLHDRPRRLAELEPQLSPFFEEVVHTLLAKRPADRFAGARELAQTLEEGERSTWWRARASALRATTRRPLRRIRIPRETALHGREAEIATLRALYDRARAGEGQVVLVEGEAGIGKTRLVDEFVGMLSREGADPNFLFGSYPPGGAATASGAFSTAYREHLGDEALEDVLAERLGVAGMLAPAFASLLRGTAPPEASPALTRDSLKTCFVHVTRSLAADRETIVLVDDLHFAPEEGRALFAAVALAVPEHRVLLVGTTRPGLDERWLSNVDRLGITRIGLSRLGPKDLVRLLADTLRSDRLAEELGAKIALASDGNPFFAFEILRGLREGQFITKRDDGTWVTTHAIGDLRIPSSILDLVNARVAALSQEERDLLDVASCLGFEFDPGLVADATGTPRIPALKALSRVERAHRLVRASGRRFVFDHHQVQEALYGSLPEMLREEYHAALGSALEARHGAESKDSKAFDGAVAVDLAEHFLRAGRGDRALRYLDAALTHLEEGWLNDAAARLADRALAEPDLVAGRARCELLLRRNARLDLLGRRDEQARTLAEALSIADSSGETDLRARVRMALGNHLHLVTRYVEARSVLEESIALARAAGDRSCEGKATGNLGAVLNSLGLHDEARARHERHLALACEIGDRLGEAKATGNIGAVLSDLERHEEAHACFERHLAMSREIDDRRGMAIATGNIGNTLYALGRYEEARAHHERHLAMSRDIGDREGESRATGNLGNALSLLGRLEDACALYERQLAMARELGDRRRESIAVGNLGNTLRTLGRLDEARVYLEQDLAICREIGDRRGEAITVGNLGNVFSLLGRHDEARAHYERYLTMSREVGLRIGEAIALTNLGTVWTSLGHPDRARDMLATARAFCREIGAQRTEGYALMGLSSAAFEEGNAEEALRLAEEALALRRSLGHGPGIAESLLEIGDLRRRAGDADVARAALDEALALLESQNRKGELAVARALLASLPGGDPRAAAAARQAAGEHSGSVRVRFLLWQATGDREHLDQARRLVEEAIARVPAEHHHSMRTGVRLHREVFDAAGEKGD